MRKQDWKENLFEVVKQRKHTPYKWGENDCCLFAADCILAMTGDDKAAALRGSYSSQIEAEQIMDSYGGLEKMLTHFLGEYKGPLCARRGDIVIFTAPNQHVCVGVCVGSGFQIASTGDEGLNMFSMELATKSWSVD